MNVDFARTEFGDEEREAVNRVLSGYWLASGPENEAFEKEFAEYVGAKYAISVNSGSAANLIALSSLSLSPGTKVLTSACGFPATLSPILHLGLTPVFVDYDVRSHNADISQVEKLIDSCSAVILAHTMGSPLDMLKIMELAKRLDVKVIEDCCEAVGSRLNGQHVGTFGDLGTYSFYPAHQITALGGGGMIVTNNRELANKCRSLRDWGKHWDWDSHLGDHKTTFTSTVDGIPYYKHYTYETIGYNAKLPEANAAFGRVQLKRLDGFTKRRIENYEYLKDKLSKFEEFLKIKTIPGAQPSWFGYILTLNTNAFTRDSLSAWLEEHGIRTRPFFAGNITRHKPFLKYKQDFPVADKLMRDSLFFGVWQGLHQPELDYIVSTIEGFLVNAYISRP